MPDLQIVWQPSVFAQYSAGITLTGALARGGAESMSDILLRPDEPPRDLPPDLRQAVRKALSATHCLTPHPVTTTTIGAKSVKPSRIAPCGKLPEPTALRWASLEKHSLCCVLSERFMLNGSVCVSGIGWSCKCL